MRGVDLHSHLVPDVDDGVRSLAQARLALGALRDEGVHTVVTTPHMDASLAQRPGEYERVMGRLDRAWEELAEMADRDFPDLELDRGVELRLDVPDPDLDDPRVRLAGSQAVLVEFDGFTIPLRADGVLEDMAADGWTPVLAHPERYRNGTMDRLRELQDAGAVLQVNAGSLVGRYGPEARTMAWRLVSAGMVAVVGSDYHGHREPDVAEARGAVIEQLGEDAAWLMFAVNGRRVLDGEPPAPVQVERRPRKGILDRIAGWLDAR